MGRKYDIVNKINAGTQRPTLMVDKDHEFKINTNRAAVLSIMALVEDQNQKDTSYTESFEVTDKILKIALGEEACKYIETLDLDFNTYMGLSTVIMAAIQDEDLEKVEKEVAEQAGKFRENPETEGLKMV